jgi:hypothetical protein
MLGVTSRQPTSVVLDAAVPIPTLPNEGRDIPGKALPIGG